MSKQKEWPERTALRAVAYQAAFEAEVPVCHWLQVKGIPRADIYNDGRPSLRIIYQVCDAAGVKVSDFFRRIGR